MICVDNHHIIPKWGVTLIQYHWQQSGAHREDPFTTLDFTPCHAVEAVRVLVVGRMLVNRSTSCCVKQRGCEAELGWLGKHAEWIDNKNFYVCVGWR